MRLVVSTEARLLRTPDGRVWTVNGPARPFWERYLASFDQVRVLARVLNMEAIARDVQRVDGDAVEVWPVPHYLGPQQYALRRRLVRRAVLSSAERTDAVLLRVPSVIGSILAASRRRNDLPYALEVVGDPLDVFAPGAMRHPLRAALRTSISLDLRRQCRTAAAVAYVTERTLQRRYPAHSGGVTAAYSSVELRADAFAGQPRPIRPRPNPPILVSVGSLEQPYKGVDTILEAVSLLKGRGENLLYVHVGEGRLLPSLERLARRLGLADCVKFAGAVRSSVAVREFLDRADLFVMPSRAEGLPRALVEAMARAVPAIASDVGGIPELLASEYLVAANDPIALAHEVRELLNDPLSLARASVANLRTAQQYSIDNILQRRKPFYDAVRETQLKACR